MWEEHSLEDINNLEQCQNTSRLITLQAFACLKELSAVSTQVFLCFARAQQVVGLLAEEGANFAPVFGEAAVGFVAGGVIVFVVVVTAVEASSLVFFSTLSLCELVSYCLV